MEDNKSIAYFLLGLGAGVAIGMIFAPVSGTEARERIRDRALESGEFLRRRSEDLRDSASDAVQKGREVLNRQRDQVSAAVDAGKQAYREAVSTPQGSPGPQAVTSGAENL